MSAAAVHRILYRAVRPAELADIREHGRLRNLRYADMAQTAFDDGPYFIIHVKVGVISLKRRSRWMGASALSC